MYLRTGEYEEGKLGEIFLDINKEVAGVDHVEALEAGRYRVFLAANSDADALVATAVQQEWGLYELIPEQQSLEDLFIELTLDEEASAK